MHPRTIAKLQALNEIGEGAEDYRTFVKAASFGQIPHEDLVNVKGYQRGLRWASSHSNDPDSFGKDHMLSRKWAFDHRFQIRDHLSLELAAALMTYSTKMGIRQQPDTNHALWLMAVICGMPENCEVMSVRENSRKGAACSQTLGELCEKIARPTKVDCRPAPCLLPVGCGPG